MSHMKERIDLDHQRQQEAALPCSICGHPIAVEPSGWREGHNAEPVVKEGRCCAACNQTVVIPKRLARFTRSEQEDRDEWQVEYDLHHPELVDPMKEER